MNEADIKKFPSPAIWITPSGEIGAVSDALRELLDFHDPPGRLPERFSVFKNDGMQVVGSDLPWRTWNHAEKAERELREVWFDRKLSRSIFLQLKRIIYQGERLLLVGEETTRGLELASGLGLLSTALLRTEDWSSVARLIVGQASSLLRAEAVYLAQHRSEDNRLVLAASKGLPAHLQAAWSEISFDAPFMTAKAARTREIQQVSDIGSINLDTYRQLGQLYRNGLRSFVAVPLVTQDELFGVLAIARRFPGYLGWQEMKILRGIAGSITMIFQQLKTIQTERGTASSLRSVWSALETITPDLPFKELVDQFAQKATELVDAEFGALGLLSEDQRSFCNWASAGSLSALADYPSVLGENRTLKDVLQHPRPARSVLVLPGTANEQRPFLVVPLQLHYGLIGIMCVVGRANTPQFSHTDVRLLELFGDKAALTFDYARRADQLQEQNSRYEAILKSIPSAVVFAESRGDMVIQGNVAAEEIFGKHFEGESIESFETRYQFRDQHGHPLPEEQRPFWRALTKGERTQTREIRLVRPDHSEIPVWVNAAPWTSAKGEIIGAVMTVRDITAVRDLDRLREEFAAVIAHDLRNPIQAIMMQAEFLARQAEGPSVSVPITALHRMYESAENLAAMTNDLLDASRLETHRLTVQPQPLDAAHEIDALLQRIKPTLGSHPVAFHGPSESIPLHADPLRFDQIMTNLLENAAKYSPPTGRIEVSVEANERGTSICVADEGIGISENDLPHLFDRFFQAKRAREKKTGLGLGLFITKGFVEAHGGSISVESKTGRGSRFTVWFPSESEAKRRETGKVA